jgi:hypothetical protein
VRKHAGTRGRYVEGCRCKGCTAANARYQRRWMFLNYIPKQAAPKQDGEDEPTTIGKVS